MYGADPPEKMISVNLEADEHTPVATPWHGKRATVCIPIRLFHLFRPIRLSAHHRSAILPSCPIALIIKLLYENQGRVLYILHFFGIRFASCMLSGIYAWHFIVMRQQDRT